MFDDGHRDELEAERTRLYWLEVAAENRRRRAQAEVNNALFELRTIRQRKEELK